MGTPDLLTTREAAEILGCSVSQAHRLADLGELPIAHKVPGLRGPRLFRRTDVERLAAEVAS